VGLDVALIEEASGESEAVGFSLSHYTGVEDGERWNEGQNHGRAVAGGVRPGRYLLRAEPVLETGSRLGVGPAAHLQVVRGVFLLPPLVLSLVLILAWPILATVSLASFEQRRWAESDQAGAGSGGGDGGEDDS
jgi:hypothetical protein